MDNYSKMKFWICFASFDFYLFLFLSLFVYFSLDFVCFCKIITIFAKCKIMLIRIEILLIIKQYGYA